MITESARALACRIKNGERELLKLHSSLSLASAEHTRIEEQLQAELASILVPLISGYSTRPANVFIPTPSSCRIKLLPTGKFHLNFLQIVRRDFKDPIGSLNFSEGAMLESLRCDMNEHFKHEALDIELSGVSIAEHFWKPSERANTPYF